MKYKIYKAIDLLNVDYPSYMSEELATLFYSYVWSNLKFCADFIPELNDDNIHFVLVLEDENQFISAFRYFFWENSATVCHLFAVVVDEPKRQQGYAINLLNEVVNFANENGIFRFNITMNSKETNARAGLFEAYKKECLQFKEHNRFYITHMGKEVRIP